jgi:hypothetical protein
VKRTLFVVAVLVAGLTLGACTFVPTDAQPQVVPNHAVPFNLLKSSPPTKHTSKSP